MSEAREQQKRSKKKRKKASPFPKEAVEIAELERRLRVESPRRGWHPEMASSEEPTTGQTGNGSTKGQVLPVFASLPISQRTLVGLDEAGFVTMRPIQHATIPHALAGRDVLGAARTGSGKTVAFVVPLLEVLYRNRWSADDGLGALVISPTRELALQTFQVLSNVGAHHDLSAGAVTGGGGGSQHKKDFAAERARVGRMCVLVATPGRILQHLRESPGFDASRTALLVVDEADRALDAGFAPQIDAVVEYLPRHRQTLLFSATLAGTATSSGLKKETFAVSPRLRKFRALIRQSEAEFVAAATDHQTLAARQKASVGGGKKSEDNGKSLFAPTPRKLRQSYVVCELQEKLDVCYSFIKAHLRCKTIVFVSACQQVKFLLEALRGLQPGVPLLALHGKLSQPKRTAIYYSFQATKHCVLFATDLAARGLDFPAVDWILQLDAPEDVEAYVHRAGRAARSDKNGDALLVLLPSEETCVAKALRDAKIPCAKLAVNPSRRQRSCLGHVAALVAREPRAKELAEKAFRAYVRSVVLAKDKQAFRAEALPLKEFAASLGLATTPKIKLPATHHLAAEARDAAHAKKNVNRKLAKLKESIKQQKKLSRAAKSDQKTSSSENNDDKAAASRHDDDDDDDLFVAAERDDDDDDDDARDSSSAARDSSVDAVAAALQAAPRPRKRFKVANGPSSHKLKIRGGVDASNRSSRVVFDDDGRPRRGLVSDTLEEPLQDDLDADALRAKNDAFVSRVRDRLRAAEAEDRVRDRDARRERKKSRRAEAAGSSRVVREGERHRGGTPPVAVLAGGEFGDDDDDTE